MPQLEELIEKCKYSDGEIHKIIDHWNPLPSRLDGIAPEELKFKLFRKVADEAVKQAIPIIQKAERERIWAWGEIFCDEHVVMEVPAEIGGGTGKLPVEEKSIKDILGGWEDGKK